MSLKKAILILPTFLLMACGGYQTQPANSVAADLNEQGHISQGDMDELNSIPEETQDQVHVISETLKEDGTVVFTAGKATATVTYMNDADYAMKINDVLVPHAVAQDSKSLEALIMGILGQQLSNLIGLIPTDIQSLIEAGLQLINGGDFAEGLESIVRILIKGFYDKFISLIPFGDVIAPILDSLIGGLIGDDDAPPSEDNTGDTNDGPENTIADGILDFISGLF